MELTPRIKRRIHRDYTPDDRQAVEELLSGLAENLRERGYLESERIIAATLLRGEGNVDQLLDAAEIARLSFRSVLMTTGLENSDWGELLDSEFGTDS